MHDFVCLLNVDFKMKNQKGTFSSYFVVCITFKKEENAVQVHKKLSDVYGEELFKLRQNWFAKFH